MNAATVPSPKMQNDPQRPRAFRVVLVGRVERLISVVFVIEGGDRRESNPCIESHNLAPQPLGHGHRESVVMKRM